MARIIVNNPRQVINGGAKKYYFKVKGLGGPKGDKGDKGDTGSQGPQGPQGNAATISVGSTTTLAVGQDATVENVGSIYNAVLNFGIPQGPRGPQGATGAKGDKGDKGDQGNPGPQGEKGTNATVTVGTTTTTEPGTQAYAWNSSSNPNNAVINFNIPRGDAGPMPEIAQTTGTSTTKVMSQNATTEALTTGLAAKQDKLTAGANIQIQNGTISATDTTYTAGNGLNLNGTEFSADTDILATKEDLEGYYTKPETDNLLAPKLEAEVVAELPTTGAEGKLYLTPKAHTTQTATGNPVTASVTEQAGAIESFQLDGDTFQQSYTGKNLVNIDEFTIQSVYTGLTIQLVNKDKSTGAIGFKLTGSVAESLWSVYAQTNEMQLEPNTTYTLSRTFSEVGGFRFAGGIRIKIGSTYQTTTTDASTTFTTDATGIAQVLIYATYNQQGPTSNINSTVTFSNLLLEKGSTVTSFEPFVGGQPSPSPSYPQQIQTVTGTQTISINGTNYPLDLGSIELCEISEGYGDYIWKDGDDWKVHKATGKEQLTGTEGWQFTTNGNAWYVANWTTARGARTPQSNDEVGAIRCADFTAVARNTLASIANGIGIASSAAINIKLDGYTTSDSNFAGWVSQNKPVVYYSTRLASQTDTTITDTALISQLEAIRTAALENGANTITNTATGSNLAGDMEIGYYGFNPRNRYDKWLWLDINNEYEQIGS
jgi:hypothetical protein